MSALLVAMLATLAQEPEALVRQAVEDYVVGQYEADPARVSGVLHPDLAKRGLPDAEAVDRELFPVRRMTSDELIDSARRGDLRTPPDQQTMTVRILDLTDRTAIVRVDTPWFTDQLQLARFRERWLVVNALWTSPQ